MAYFEVKPNGKVYFWDKTGKRISRKEYRYLDGQGIEAINSFRAKYELQYEGKKWNPNCAVPKDLQEYLNDYEVYLTGRRKLDAVTVQQHVKYLTEYTFVYFLTLDEPLRDFTRWPSKSIGMVEYMEKAEITPSIIFRTRICTNLFWKWLRLHGKVATELPLMPYAAPKSKTPLQVLKSPKEMVSLIAGMHPELRLLALLGYFFSLRPQESFAFSSGDVAAGDAAARLECCKDMAAVGLYGRLALRPRQQRRGKVVDLKKLKTTGSEAWVACFDEAAARLFVEEVRGKTEFFPRNTKYYYELWRLHGVPGVSLKDLRRASLYHLGHKVDGMKNFVLQKHARHARIETTERYLRRPEEQTMQTSLADLHLVL